MPLVAFAKQEKCALMMVSRFVRKRLHRRGATGGLSASVGRWLVFVAATLGSSCAPPPEDPGRPVPAELSVKPPDVLPGQFVNVRLLIDTLKGVVVIPTPAVQRGPNNVTFVYVLAPENRVTKRAVTVAHLAEAQAVIADGIEASDRVVTTGFARLKDGASVALPATEEQPPAASAAPAKAEQRAGLRSACAGDIEKLCANVERSRVAIRACLQANTAQLSAACRAAVASAEDRPRRGDLRKAEGSPKE